MQQPGQLTFNRLTAFDPFTNWPDGAAVTLHEVIPAEALNQLSYYQD